MYDAKPDRARRVGRVTGAVALLAGGAVAGGILATSLSASAASTSTTQTPAATASPGAGGPARGAAPVRAGETALAGSNAQRARAAALKAVPGGTVYRVETDADGDAYEAHMTKPDGSLVTVKFDKNFTVTRIEEGMGVHHGG